MQTQSGAKERWIKVKPGTIAIKTIVIQNAINGLLRIAEDCTDINNQNAMFNLADHLATKLVEAKHNARM